MRVNKNARQIVALVSASALVAGLAACSTPPASDTGTAPDSDTGAVENVTISFWDDNGGPARTPVYEELIERFEAEHPSITVDYLGLPASDSVLKIETAVAGGATPDVAIVDGNSLSSLVVQGALLSLEDRYAASDLNGKIGEDALAASRYSAPNGELYLMPMTGNADVIWYNSELFAEAGVEAPNTYAEFIDAAVSLTDADAGQYGFAMRGAAGSTSQLLAEMFACSGVEAFYDANGVSTFEDPRFAECVQQFAGLYRTATSRADLGYGYPEMIAAFTSGQSAMVRHNLGSAQDHIDALGDGVAVAVPMPAKDASGERTLIASKSNGPAIFSSSEKQDAAWTFVEFLLSAESNSYWNEMAGQIPTNVDARQAAWVAEAQWVSATVSALSDPTTTVVTPPVYLPDFGSIVSDAVPDFQAVVLGDKTAQDFLSDLAERLTTAESEFRAGFVG